MKRLRLYREGVPSQEQQPRTIKPGGVTFPEGLIPVYAHDPTQSEAAVIGGLTGFRREPNGWVTAKPSGFRLLKGFALAAHIHGEHLIRDDVMGDLQGCHVTDKPVWPGMVER